MGGALIGGVLKVCIWRILILAVKPVAMFQIHWFINGRNHFTDLILAILTKTTNPRNLCAIYTVVPTVPEAILNHSTWALIAPS